MKNITLYSVLLVCLVLGCTQSSCGTCPSPGSWSSCDNSGMKIRLNYQCNNSQCQAYNESSACATTVTVTNGGLTVVISPTLDNYVSGLITIEATSLPAGTTKVTFMMYPQSSPIDLNAGLAANQLFTMDAATTSWIKYVDTTALEDGLYTLAVLPSGDTQSESSPWLAVGQTQLIINNE